MPGAPARRIDRTVRLSYERESAVLHWKNKLTFVMLAVCAIAAVGGDLLGLGW